MAVSVVLRTSIDAGNAATFGTDGGLYASAGIAPRAGTFGFAIDNSWATAGAGTYAYVLPTQAYANAAMMANYAFVQPIMFSRNCTIAGAYLSITGAGTGSSIYTASYASNAATGMPAAKIVDVMNATGAATGVKAMTMTDTSTVYAAGIIYWFATWAYASGSFPTITVRQAAAMNMGIRVPLSAPPSSSAFLSGNTQMSFMDNAQTWSTLTSAPATLTTNTPSSSVVPGSTTGLNAPQFWWVLQNV